jgi:hypothetical protein
VNNTVKKLKYLFGFYDKSGVTPCTYEAYEHMSAVGRQISLVNSKRDQWCHCNKRYKLENSEVCEECL